MNEKNKEKALVDIKKDLEKRFGKGIIQTLNDSAITGVESISTGITSLDTALGVGGIPRGRIIEIFGQEASGKSLISQIMMVSAQKQNGRVALVDTEHAHDPMFGKQLGINYDKLDLIQPDSAENALEIIDTLVSSELYDIVVLDSIAACVPQKELEGEMGQLTVGLMARLMGQALRKLTAKVSKSKTVLIFINQLRSIIPQPGQMVWGDSSTTPGGRALKFYASVRIQVSGAGTKFKDKESGRQCGHRVKAKIVKNKVGPPFMWSEFNLFYASYNGKQVGIDYGGLLLEEALLRNIISIDGKTYEYKGRKLGVGEFATSLSIDNDKELQKELHELILKTPLTPKFEAGDADEESSGSAEVFESL